MGIYHASPGTLVGGKDWENVFAQPKVRYLQKQIKIYDIHVCTVRFHTEEGGGGHTRIHPPPPPQKSENYDCLNGYQERTRTGG